jgi:hypothetical protein
MRDEDKKIILRKMNRAYDTLEEAEMMAGAGHWNTQILNYYRPVFIGTCNSGQL